MNQNLIFNNDFALALNKKAVTFSCLVAGLKVQCYIPLPASISPPQFLQLVINDAFSWEDSAEQAIADDAYNADGEIWL